MIKQLEKAIREISELSEIEQEAIAQMILATIENTRKEQKENDPLAQLKNSDFIGCFSDEPDLAEKSEQITQDIMAKKS